MEDKKAAVVVCIGKFNYATVMTVTRTRVRVTHDMGDTAEELVC